MNKIDTDFVYHADINIVKNTTVRADFWLRVVYETGTYQESVSGRLWAKKTNITTPAERIINRRASAYSAES